MILSDIQEFVTGERPIDASDRVLATVLFLDIASSTERATALGDAAWGNLLNAYYSIVRKELARFRGKETNTAGDGFLAIFDGPARAIRCAIAITVVVRQLRIDVRAGLHTGECEMMGDNVGGFRRMEAFRRAILRSLRRPESKSIPVVAPVVVSLNAGRAATTPLRWFGSGLGVMPLTLPFDRALEAECNLTRGTARRQFSCRLRSGSNCTSRLHRQLPD
jgi:hypothetical protein